MKLVKLTILLLCLPLLSFANEKHKKQKHTRKSFEVNANATLSVKNIYGEISVEVWDKNVVQLDVFVTISGTNLKKVTKRFNNVTIDFKGTKDLVEAKTIIKNAKNWLSYPLFGEKEVLTNDIYYLIKIPKSINLKIQNKYGRVSLLSDVDGTTNIDCKYSNFFASALNNISNNIKLMYCGGSRIFYMKGGKVYAMYSEIEIEKSEKLLLNTSYTDVDIQKATEVYFEMDYGELSIKEAVSLRGSGDYTDIGIGTIDELHINMDYGDLRINKFRGLANSLLEGNYTKLRIGGHRENPFNIDVTTDYADFNYPQGLVTIMNKTKNKQSGSYKGFFHKKGVHKLRINANYGNVSFKHSY